MRVFITGASGHVASALIPELLSNGHEVVGLARSDSTAAACESYGADVVRGDLDDLDCLAAAASAADGVVHLAFKHELMRMGDFEGAVASDLQALATLGEALVGTDKPLVSTSGSLMLVSLGITGRPGTEHDAAVAGPRVDAENAVIALADRGVRSSVVRLPPITHSDLDHHGFAPGLIGFAREHGKSGYPGDGSNRWPSVHTRDAATLYRLALESAPAGTRLHAVADEGVPTKQIAETIGAKLGLDAVSIPEHEQASYFSYLAGFIGLDNLTSSTITRALLGWMPTHPNLIADLQESHYYES